MLFNDIRHSCDKPSNTTNRQKLFGLGCVIGGLIFCLYLFTQQRPVTFTSTSLQHWYTAEQRLKRPVHIDPDHGFCGPCPPDKQLSNAWQLTDLVDRISPVTPFLVNIGAASAEGGRYDPTYPLLSAANSSFAALLIDPNTDSSLFAAYPRQPNIRIVHDYIWPESIVPNIFRKYNISKHFALLKVDIDSYECALLEAILRADYRPQIIHTEFNPMFPPPVRFMPLYDSATKDDWKPPLWSNNGPFYGCSLSALSRVLRSFDYVLVDVDFWDVIYVERQLAQSYDIQVPGNDVIAYEHGFVNHSCFSYCQQNVKLYNSRLETAIKTVLNQSNFTQHMRSVLDIFAPLSVKDNLKHPYIISL